MFYGDFALEAWNSLVREKISVRSSAVFGKSEFAKLDLETVVGAVRQRADDLRTERRFFSWLYDRLCEEGPAMTMIVDSSKRSAVVRRL